MPEMAVLELARDHKGYSCEQIPIKKPSRSSVSSYWTCKKDRFQAAQVDACRVLERKCFLFGGVCGRSCGGWKLLPVIYAPVSLERKCARTSDLRFWLRHAKAVKRKAHRSDPFGCEGANSTCGSGVGSSVCRQEFILDSTQVSMESDAALPGMEAHVLILWQPVALDRKL